MIIKTIHQMHLRICVFICLCQSVIAADRVALVIGNGAYEHTSKLPNATKDAASISKLLEGAGFQVISVKGSNSGGMSNIGTEEFYKALENFKALASGAKVGLFYYAGHGVEVGEKNYLLPVDASLETSAQLRTQAVPLDTILDDMKEARISAKILILDCCRNNPLTRSWLTTRSINRGLAEVKEAAMPEATMIMYSTAPGKVALDGNGGNSPFTKALLTNLTEPGVNAFDAFLKVSDQVARDTSETQVPWIKFDGAGRAFRQLVFEPPAALPHEPVMSVPSTPPVRPSVEPSTPPQAVQQSTLTSVTVEVPLKMLKTDELFANGPYAASSSQHQTVVITRVQELLKRSGLYDLTPDGVAGAGTQAALRKWQEKHGLVMGRLDTQTLKQMGLDNIPHRTSPRPSAPSGTPPSGKAGNPEITVDEFMRRAKALEGR